MYFDLFDFFIETKTSGSPEVGTSIAWMGKNVNVDNCFG